MWVRKLIGLAMGSGKKIYRPEGPIFWPKTAFSVPRGIMFGKCRKSTRGAKDSLFGRVG